MNPTIFIGPLPGEDEVRLLVNGETVAVFVSEIHETQDGQIANPWGMAHRLIEALVNDRGAWTADGADGMQPYEQVWLRPKSDNRPNFAELKTIRTDTTQERGNPHG